MDDLIDTNFLIGRWRRGSAGPEQTFIENNLEAAIGLPWVVKAEFLRGAVLAGHPHRQVSAFLDHVPVVWPDEETLQIYAGTYAILHRSSQLIGPQDLWIASRALRLALPVVTSNAAEFRRIPDLEEQHYLSSP